MRKITLVKLENKDQDTWYRVNSKDIVKVSYIVNPEKLSFDI